MGLGSTWNSYCFPYSFIEIPVKYIKYVGCAFLVSRHWSWVLITSTLCSVQGLKINPHTTHTDTFCYFPNFLQAVAGITPWSCSMLFILTSQLQLQVYMRSKFSVTIYETPATCCGCTQSWQGSKFTKLVAEELWWWTFGAKLWWNLSAEDKRRVLVSHGHIHSF